MNTDIRISVSFKGHRKRKRLKMVLGAGSTDYLIDLWISTAMNHPDGKLVGMDEIDIALEAGWEGDAKEFVDALVRCGFLDECESGYCLHDWENHQLYAVHAEERKERARNAAAKRWGKRNNANSMPEAMLKDANSMPEAMPLPTPSPTPSPSPTPTPLVRGGAGGQKNTNKQFVAPTVEQVLEYCLENNYQFDAGLFVDHYTSNGWMVGRNKMKDWKAAVRTWVRNGKTRSMTKNGAQKTSRQQYMEDVGNLLEGIDEATNNGCPARLGQAADSLPGVRPQQDVTRKIGV